MELVNDKFVTFKTTKIASVLKEIETNKVKKKTLFDQTRQYNIQNFHKNLFFKYEQHKSKLQKRINKLLILIPTAV